MTKGLDWRDVSDDREKYAAYLCSREWAILKEAVHKRAGGICERCDLFPIDAVHHLTYERKYAEEMEDLAGWCRRCHDFVHSKSDLDIEQFPHRMRRYFRLCVGLKLIPPPVEWELMGLSPRASVIDCAVRLLLVLTRSIGDEAEDALSDAMDILGRHLGFDLRLYNACHDSSWRESEYDYLRRECGFPNVPQSAFSDQTDQDELKDPLNGTN